MMDCLYDNSFICDVSTNFHNVVQFPTQQVKLDHTGTDISTPPADVGP